MAGKREPENLRNLLIMIVHNEWRILEPEQANDEMGRRLCENYSTIWMIPKWKPRTRQRRRVRRVKCLIWEEILTILLLENFFTQASASSSCRLHFQKVLSFLFFPSSAWVSSDLLSSDNTHRQCGTQEEREIITMMSTKKGGSGWNFSFSFFLSAVSLRTEELKFFSFESTLSVKCEGITTTTRNEHQKFHN